MKIKNYEQNTDSATKSNSIQTRKNTGLPRSGISSLQPVTSTQLPAEPFVGKDALALCPGAEIESARCGRKKGLLLNEREVARLIE